MRALWIFFSLILIGCTTPPAPTASPISNVVPVVSPTKLAETSYAVGTYWDPADPTICHDSHIIHRRTRVPAAASDDLPTVSLSSYPPISFVPLPASDELTAELATQKQITADLRRIQASMAETEQLVQAQYTVLVQQSAEVQKAHEQLEAERRRTKMTSAESTVTAQTDKPVGKTAAEW
jgi:hypothetical protein